MSDEEFDDEPSKSARKRDAQRLKALGQQLAELNDEQRAALPLPETLAKAIADYRRITAHEAKRRQGQYIGRLMRARRRRPNSKHALAGIDAHQRRRPFRTSRNRTLARSSDRGRFRTDRVRRRTSDRRPIATARVDPRRAQTRRRSDRVPCVVPLSARSGVGSCRRSGRFGSANRDLIDAQRRLTHADRHRLTVFAAHADAFVEREVVTDHRHALS